MATFLLHTMDQTMQDQLASEAGVATMPTYRRTLSSNELSCFLPSRACGLNDVCNQATIHAPVFDLAAATLHCVGYPSTATLMACRVEMQPGRYDAQFALTPPSSPNQALAEATACVRIFDNMYGSELNRAWLAGDLRFCHYGDMIGDGIAIQENMQIILELLGGSSIPGGPPRTDAELRQILDDDGRSGGALKVMRTTLSHPLRRLGFWDWCRPSFNRRRGKSITRISRNDVLPDTFFRASKVPSQISASATNMGFALCNFAWIRFCAVHPEINALKDLPMLMYTAINLRRYLTLQPASPLESCMYIVLDYHNVVLPAFLPAGADPREMFWARSRAAQRQIAKEGAKAWARIDDAAARALSSPPAPCPPPAPNSAPSLALLGFSHNGNSD
ncbi:hypothetical protein K438DRAFT_2033401 [Mycena galopus ATCC 62051]|nr:hypothetical protein K438DRAFT_2033401 [Mycena galopus ATCC 62051]